MNDPIFPLRAIVDREPSHPRGSRTGTGSVILTLECGHKTRRKRSAEPKGPVRCEQCYYDQSRG